MHLLPMIAWFLALAQSVEPAVDHRVIVVGSETTGTLPVRLEARRNAAEAVFELETGAETSVTLTLESLDFDAKLVVKDAATGVEREDRRSWRHSNAWIVQPVEAPAKLLVRVTSEDDRGGEFVLAVKSGRIDPPRGGDEVRGAVDYCEAVAARASAGGEPERAARYFGSASQAAYFLRDFPKAKELAGREVGAAEATGLPDSIMRARMNLGGAQRELGELAEARANLESAWATLEPALAAAKNTAPRLAAMAMFVNDHLGEIARVQSGHAGAVRFLRRAVDLTTRAERPDFAPTAWGKLGGALGQVGQVAEARAAVERGLALAEDLGQPALLAGALQASAWFEVQQGSPGLALAACERALELSPPPEIALELRGTLAWALTDLGRYEEAAEALDAVETGAQQIGLDRHEIPIRIARARIAYDLWDLPHASELLGEALSMQEASGSPLHRVEILRMLGLVAQDLGQERETESRYAAALETCEATGDLVQMSRVLVDLGRHHEAEARLDEAASMYILAEDTAGAAGAPSDADVARTGRAFVLCLQGKFLEAKELAAAVAGRCEAAGDLRVAEAAYDTLARAALATGGLETAERMLCAAQPILDGRSAPRTDRLASAGIRSRLAGWGAIAQDLCAAKARAAGSDEALRDGIVHEGWWKAGEWKGRVLFEQMHRRATGSEDADASAGPALPRIGVRTSVVEYVEGLGELYAYVATRGRVRLVALGSCEEIEERTRTFVEAIAGHRSTPRTIAEEGTWLYERLVAPLLLDLSSDPTIVFIPSPAVSILPFEALVRPGSTPSGAEPTFAELRYLIEDACVVYAPSAPVLAELQARGPRKETGRFLVLGDPLYGSEANSGAGAEPKLAVARPGGAGFDYTRLKRTREETLELGRILLVAGPSSDEDRKSFLRAGSERSTVLHAPSFDLYLGSHAARTVLEGDLAAYGTIHIAAHGHVDPDDPRRSGIVLTDGPTTRPLFTLEEVLGLRLDADLAVLSACDTARGRILRGEGVQSLACGFLQAGSRSVVATLWKIEDDEASIVVRSFYASHLEQRVHPALALRRAKLELARSRGERGKPVGWKGSTDMLSPANPYFWAPFVYIGSPPE